MKEEINLVKIMEIIMKLWWLVLVFALVIGLVAFSISSFLMTPLYTSTAKVYADSSGRPQGTGINMNDLATSTRLVSSYIEVLCSDAFLNNVAVEINKEHEDYNLSAGKIKSNITMNSANETEILEIKYSDISPQRAQDVLNKLLELAPTQIERIITGGTIKTVDLADKPTSTSYPDVKQNTFIGIFIGIVLGIAVILIKELLDTRIKDDDDLKNRYNIPVLGIIPNLDSE